MENLAPPMSACTYFMDGPLCYCFILILRIKKVKIPVYIYQTSFSQSGLPPKKPLESLSNFVVSPEENTPEIPGN